MIKEVNLENRDFAVISGFIQWDKGQMLKITGIDLPEGTEIHFSLQEKGGTAAVKEPVKVEDGYEVKIPQFIFEGDATEDYHAYAFIYQEEGDVGETTHKIKMHITARPRHDGYVYDDEVLTWKQLDERIKKLEENGTGGGAVDVDIGGVEITDGEPTKESTVMTLNPNADDINIYTAEEIDVMFGSYVTDIANLIGGIEE